MAHENLQVETVEGVAVEGGLAAGVEAEDSAEGEHEVDEADGVQFEEDDEDVIQFAMGNHAVQGAWATGFSSPGRTWPGHLIRSDLAEVVFDGVTVGGEKDFVTQAFENFYDWGDLMRIILSAVENRTISIEDMEVEIHDEFSDWLTTLEGWGLLSSVVHIQDSRHFLMALLYTSANWAEATGGLRTDRKVFNSVKFIYDHIEGKSLSDMVPQFGVWFEEMETRQKSLERTKRLVVFIKGQWDFEVKFSVTKRRKVGSTLLELAAEAVAEQVWKEEYIDTRKLEVAETLQDLLLENFHDVTWVRKHWGTSLDSPSETYKDAVNIPMSKKFSPGEPLEEEVGSNERQAEVVDVNMQSLLSGYDAHLATMMAMEQLEEEEKATGQLETAAAPECLVCLEEMVPSTRIFNCFNGHFVCEMCRSNMNNACCPVCRGIIIGKVPEEADYEDKIDRLNLARWGLYIFAVLVLLAWTC